jgi:hypothetical protein
MYKYSLLIRDNASKNFLASYGSDDFKGLKALFELDETLKNMILDGDESTTSDYVAGYLDALEEILAIIKGGKHNG